MIYWLVELYQREKTWVIYGSAGCYWLVELLYLIQMLNCFPLIDLLIYYVMRETPKREMSDNLWKSPMFLPYVIVDLFHKGILRHLSWDFIYILFCFIIQQLDILFLYYAETRNEWGNMDTSDKKGRIIYKSTYGYLLVVLYDNIWISTCAFLLFTCGIAI